MQVRVHPSKLICSITIETRYWWEGTSFSFALLETLPLRTPKPWLNGGGSYLCRYTPIYPGGHHHAIRNADCRAALFDWCRLGRMCRGSSVFGIDPTYLGAYQKSRYFVDFLGLDPLSTEMDSLCFVCGRSDHSEIIISPNGKIWREG